MPSSMARIPVRDTAPERAVRDVLSRLGFPSPDLNVASLPGRPDVVLSTQRIAAFAHGCYWHHHQGCRHGRVPATSYPWANKFAATRARDVAAREALIARGWRVAWVWECALLGAEALQQEELDARVTAFVTGKQKFMEVEGRGVLRPSEQAHAA
jgi:DNA mismatch endonuclease (patch repair protein)